MSVQPGFGGQTFQPDVLEKISILQNYFQGPVQIDGGINAETIKIAAAAGVDWFVAGSAVFGAEDPVAAARSLLKAAEAVS
jgi:ribulose-phosphate 3-epimerase